MNIWERQRDLCVNKAAVVSREITEAESIRDRFPDNEELQTRIARLLPVMAAKRDRYLDRARQAEDKMRLVRRVNGNE